MGVVEAHPVVSKPNDLPSSVRYSYTQARTAVALMQLVGEPASEELSQAGRASARGRPRHLGVGTSVDAAATV